jgi:two-component system response regulator YesN
MVQVLIVDDEKEIRNGLVTQIPWADWGVDKVYDADDGDTALSLALLHKPDLIITDIRMPRMSGLQLIEELARRKFVGSIIVISGYDDFRLVKEAFKLGISDYLLKPIDKAELSQVVAVTLHQLSEQNLQEHNQNLFRQSFEQAIPKMREETLQELIESSFTNGLGLRIENKLKQLKLDWIMQEPLRLVVFGIDDLKALTKEKPPGEKDLLLFAAGNILQYFFAEQYWGHYVLFRSKQDNWVMIIGGGVDGDSFDNLESLYAAVCEQIQTNTKILVHVGTTPDIGTINQLSEIHQKAFESLVYIKVHGTILGSEDDDFNDNNVILLLGSLKDMVDQLKYGTEMEIRQVMELYPKLVKSWNIQHPKDLQQRTFEWLLEVFRTAQKTGWKESAWEKNPVAIWESFERFDTLESLQKHLTAQLLQAAESMKGQFVSRSQIVFEAERIISQQYHENLTLQIVAEHVYVTPVWLSKLFKKELGINFLEYLTDVRLNKAVQLLMDLNFKVYQVSHHIGYQDPVYFTRLFKKKFGCTPQEFRNNRGNTNE